MKVLISCAGSHGDVLPFIAIGREMHDRGHDVVLFANPFIRDHVTDAGLRFGPISTVDEYSRLFGSLSESDPKTALQRIALHLNAICRDYYEAMKAEIAAGQTIAIGSSLLFAARLLRETDGVPCTVVHLAPSVIRSNVRPPRLVPKWITADTPMPIKRLVWWLLDRTYYEPQFAVPLNQLRAKLGLAPVTGIFRSWIHEADCAVALFPEWFAPRQPDWPARLVSTGFPLYDGATQAPLPDKLAAFIDAGPPPVAFSAGTANADAKGFFETSVAACRLAGLRGVLISHFPGQVPQGLPADILHVPYAPFGTLLPKLSAFVHHGGIGSTSQTLRAGVPQLIRPVAFDQFDNSARVVHLGVARELLLNRYSARAAAKALLQLMSDGEVRMRCREVASRFSGVDAIRATCDAITARTAPGVAA